MWKAHFHKWHDIKDPIPGSNADTDKVVQVQFAPSLDICCERGAEENPADIGRRARQEDGGKLLSETCLTVLKELIRLIHHQPLHTTHRQNMSILQTDINILQREHSDEKKNLHV